MSKNKHFFFVEAYRESCPNVIKSIQYVPNEPGKLKIIIDYNPPEIKTQNFNKKSQIYQLSISEVSINLRWPDLSIGHDSDGA